jgi:hypothetical protein
MDNINEFLQRIEETQQNIEKILLSQKGEKSMHRESIKKVTYSFKFTNEIITFEP